MTQLELPVPPSPPSVIDLAIASGEPPLTVRRWLEDPGSVGRRARSRLRELLPGHTGHGTVRNHEIPHVDSVERT